MNPGRRSKWLAKIVWFVVIAVSGTNTSVSQSSDHSTDATETSNYSWSLLPIIFSSPDTDLAFGLLPQLVFRAPGSERLSRALLEGYYTLKSQYSFAARGSFWINRDRDNVDFDLAHKYWPTSFYGLNAKNAKIPGVDYVEQTTTLSIRASRKIGSGLRVGLSAGLRRSELLPGKDDEVLDLGDIRGESGGWVISLGPSVGIDSRDHVFYPTSGWLASAAVTLNGYILGGNFDFVSSKIDIRNYRKLAGNHVLAGQFVLHLKSAGVPFWAMQGVGSSIRGYPSARFLDINMVSFQMEYRIVPAVWRVGLSVFAGVGTVAARVADLPSGTYRFAFGAGIRFIFMQDAKINIRWDFGFGDGTSGDYLDMPEAF